MWYSGSIVQAIKESKESFRIFLVYISGDDELSKKMDQCWDDEAVIEISTKSCVALKLKHNSEEFKQFSAIYPVLCIPSAYFIGNDGSIIEALPAQSSSKELAEKVTSVVQVFEKKNGTTSQNDSGASASSVTDSVASSSSAEQNQSESKKASELSEEDKAAKVNELQGKIQKKRVEKAQQEKEHERRKEVERRELGKSVQHLKEQQRQAKLQKDIEERKRDKIQAQEARERIKQQIEQDRLERAKKKMEHDEVEAARVQERAMDVERKKKLNEETKNAQSRLQFRLPDASLFTHTFESTDTLQFVTDFIAEQNIQLFGTNVNAFRLSQSYPRRAFAESDLGLTLRELGLTPSASLLILPRAVQRTSADDSLVSKIGSMLLFVLMLLPRMLSYIWNSLFSSPAEVEQHSNQPMPSSSQYSDGPSSNVRRRTGASKTISQKGNMTRLSDVKRDSDEDDATWNGNSTQQM